MNATNSVKRLNTTKQICAGYKIKKPREVFYEYTDHKDPTKLKFKKIDPIPYEAETEVKITGHKIYNLSNISGG